MKRYNANDDDFEDRKGFDDPNWSGDIDEPPAPKAKQPNAEFLKGSGVPRRVKVLEIEITGVRKPPQFETEFTLDFEYTPETLDELQAEDEDCEALEACAWNVNKTNRRLLELYVKRNFKAELPGCVVQLEVVPGATPDGEPCRTFLVSGLQLRGSNRMVSVERQRKRNASAIRDLRSMKEY